MNDNQTSIAWEAELANLLSELSVVQDDLLDVLSEKRRLMVANDGEAMLALEAREQNVATRLQQCAQRRETLLRRADQQGLPCNNIRELAAAIPADAISANGEGADGEGNEEQAIEAKRAALGKQAKAAALRARLLQHESLTNWVLAQRTLLHLSQILEIVATGGVEKPTYAKGQTPVATAAATGALVDRAA